MMMIIIIKMIKMMIMAVLVTLIASCALQLEMEWAGDEIEEGRGGTWNVSSQPVQ